LTRDPAALPLTKRTGRQPASGFLRKAVDDRLCRDVLILAALAPGEARHDAPRSANERRKAAVSIAAFIFGSIAIDV
jgi:hypothetical protein